MDENIDVRSVDIHFMILPGDGLINWEFRLKSGSGLLSSLNWSYPTVLKACHIIRMAIVSQTDFGDVLLKGEVEIDESYFGGKRKGKRGRGAAGKVPVFGILERKGVVEIEILKDFSSISP